MDVQHVFLLSIIYQLLDSAGDPAELSPNVQEWLAGIVEEYEQAEGEEKEYFEKVYWYADTFLNEQIGKETLN